LGKFRTFEVQLIGEIRHVVVGLRDRGRGEGVGRDDIGAGAQIFGVDVLDRLGLREDQQVVVAPNVAMEILEAFAAESGLVELQALDHGAHGAVEHEDAFAGRGQQGCALGRDGYGHQAACS
jgi:hypothetical protein